MARYLISGASGFLGKALTRALLARGHDVVTAGRANRDVSPAHINYDLNGPATADTIVAAKPDGIFHLAWSTTPSLSEADPAEDLRTNVAGSIALLQRLTGTFAGPVVFVSSGGTVYGSASLVPTPEH